MCKAFDPLEEYTYQWSSLAQYFSMNSTNQEVSLKIIPFYCAFCHQISSMSHVQIRSHFNRSFFFFYCWVNFMKSENIFIKRRGNWARVKAIKLFITLELWEKEWFVDDIKFYLLEMLNVNHKIWTGIYGFVCDCKRKMHV